MDTVVSTTGCWVPRRPGCFWGTHLGDGEMVGLAVDSLRRRGKPLNLLPLFAAEHILTEEALRHQKR